MVADGNTGRVVDPSADPLFALARSIGLSAFVFGYPLIESLRTCVRQTVAPAMPPSPGRAQVGDVVHGRHPATARDRTVVTPANDLLYSIAWFNLANGPCGLHVPSVREFGRRYFVLALYDAYTENFANLGPRNSDPDGEWVTLAGPGTSEDLLPAGRRAVRSRTDLVWMIARVLVGPREDWPAAREVQRLIQTEPPTGASARRRPRGVDEWVGAVDDSIDRLLTANGEAPEPVVAAFFTNLCRGLADSPPGEADRGLVDWFDRAGLRPGFAFDWQALQAPVRAGLVAGAQDAARLIDRMARSRQHRPWTLSLRAGRYGTDYLMRAIVAYRGMGALAPDEALYGMGDYDASNQPLVGARGYRMRFEPGDDPPCDVFWSVTLYDEDRYLYANPLERHAIGDRTEGLKRDPDGGLTLILSHQPPSDTANWLPAPEGTFYVSLRMYHPREDVRSWRIPPLEPIQGA